MIRVAVAAIAALAASATAVQVRAQDGNLREPFSSVENEAIIRLPGAGECWILGGRAESLFGLSTDRNSRMGILFTVQDGIPVAEVRVSVGLRHGFEKARATWELNFRNRGTTNGKEYVYQAGVTGARASVLLNSSIAGRGERRVLARSRPAESRRERAVRLLRITSRVGREFRREQLYQKG